MYGKLKTWIRPSTFSDLTLAQIVSKLKERTTEETIEIAERYKFFKRQQQPGETIIEYMSGLKQLASTCNFSAYLDTALRDQFVCGMRDSRMQRELLSVKDLTLTLALQKSQAIEVATKETENFQQLSSGETGSGATHALEQATHGQFGKCYRCGSGQHKARNCLHKDKRCNLCKKVGHLARVCKSVPARKISRSRQQAHTHQLEEATEEDDDDDDHFGVHKVSGNKRYRKLITTLTVGGTTLEFEVDTGAELSTIPSCLYRRWLTHIPLHPSSVVLRLYDGSVLPTKGAITTQVKQNSQSVTGSFLIVENVDNQLPLLGRDWLYQLQLDWPKLFKSCNYCDPRVHTVHVAKWISEFPGVTKEGLGLLKGIQADIELEAGARPKFCKSRPIPFALKEQVEQLIWQQVEDGELEP